MKQEFISSTSGLATSGFRELYGHGHATAQPAHRELDGFQKIFTATPLPPPVDQSVPSVEPVKDVPPPPTVTDNELKQRVEEAFREGYAAGEIAGAEKARQEFEPWRKNFQQTLQKLPRVQQEIYLMAERETVELALAVARKIIGHEISTRPQVIAEIVQDAMRLTQGQDRLKIRLNSGDIEWMEHHGLGLFGDVSIEWTADPAIEPGGCLIESQAGEIDARLSTRMARIEEALKQELAVQYTESGEFQWDSPAI